MKTIFKNLFPSDNQKERKRLAVNDTLIGSAEGVVESSLQSAILQADNQGAIADLIESSDQLALVDEQLAEVRKSKKQFGGKQTLAVIHNKTKERIRELENSIEKEVINAEDALKASNYLTITKDVF